MNVVLVEIAQPFEFVNILNIMYPTCKFSTHKKYINVYCFFFNENVCLLLTAFGETEIATNTQTYHTDGIHTYVQMCCHVAF